jgi:AcrR family transcriptional regulator
MAADPVVPLSSSRDRVLAGATEEFAQFGFAGARIDRIARRVGLNVRMIYYHFGNKDGLYRGVLREIYVRAAEFLDSLQNQTDPELRTFESVTGYFDMLTANPHFADILVREFLDGGEQLRKLFNEEPQLYERIHERANRLVDGLVGSGTVRKIPAAEVVIVVTFSASFLWASRGVHDVFLAGRTPTAEDWEARLVDLIWNGVRAR